MTVLQVTIHDEGEHWNKEIRILGILIYSRHVYIKGIEKREIGFKYYPSEYIDIEDLEDE